MILGCSADTPETQAKFKKKHKLNFALLSDTEKNMLKAYGVWQQKSFLGKKYMGVARTTFLVGPDGTIRKIFTKVKPGQHAEEVLQALTDCAARTGSGAKAPGSLPSCRVTPPGATHKASRENRSKNLPTVRSGEEAKELRGALGYRA